MNKKAKSNSQKVTQIIGIGSSAGGLEALQELLSSLPESLPDIAIVIAQHLSPSYKSMLAELLQRKSKFPVSEIINGMPLKPENIYVTPPDSDVTIKSGYLYLSRPKIAGGPKPSIDLFFQSIVHDYSRSSAGIILSGTGSDGSFGVRAIHLAGGTVIAQDPKTARYPGMPLSAIETGVVNFILPVKEIGNKIIELLQGSAQDAPRLEIEDPATEDFEKIISYLSAAIGIDFSAYKISTISRRLEKRMNEIEIDNLTDYLKKLESDNEEIEKLFSMMLIGVTEFFRDSTAFEELRKHLEAVLKNKIAGDSIRVWVPGCASGEEAYTIAMIIHDILGIRKKNYTIQIFGTDISESSLTTARAGIYSAQQIKNVPKNLLEKFFRKRGSKFEIVKEIRQTILFSRHDLTSNAPFLKLDLISCRNLLIYFGNVLQKALFPTFHHALKNEGILFLGKSESIGEFTEYFQSIHANYKIFRKKSLIGIPKIRSSGFPWNRNLEKRLPAFQKSELSIAELVKETLYNTFESPYVVINSNMEVLEVFGEVNNFLGLSSGTMNANLIKLAHSDLQLELRALVLRCIREHSMQKGNIVRQVDDGKTRFVQIRIKPVIYSQSDNQLYIVIFEDLSDLDNSKFRKILPAKESDDSRVEDLEKELLATREQLQTFIEELETSNEELQSLNEEMQSANEELQSSNEELETSNEELQSSNEETQIAYAELRQLHEEMQKKEIEVTHTNENVRALLENSQEGLILIDPKYVILAKNNIAIEMFENLADEKLEEGSVLFKYIPEKQFCDFLGDIKRASQGKFVKGEISFQKDGSNLNWSFQIYPVQDSSKSVRLISLAFLDITIQKQQQNEILRTTELLEKIFNQADIGISLIDETGKLFRVNKAFCQLYDFNEEQLIGQEFTLLIPAEERKDKMRLFQTILKKNESATYEWRMQRKDGNMIDVYRTLSVIQFPNNTKYVVTTERDVSDSKHYRKLLEQTQETVRVGGWEFEPGTNENRWTKEVYAIYDLEDNFEPKPGKDLIFYAPESRENIRQALDLAIQKGEPFELEAKLISAKNALKWVWISGRPVRVYNRTVKIYGTIQDITAKKQSEFEISKLSLVASRIQSGVVITDSNGNIDWVNTAFKRMTGYSLDELKGKKPGKILQGPETDKQTVAFMAQKLTELKAFNAEVLNYRKDGTTYWVRIEFTPIFNDAGYLLSYVGIQTDITAEVEQRLAVKQSLHEKEVLLREIHHRVKNNMAIVSSLLELQTLYSDSPELEKILTESKSRISVMALIHEKLYRSQDLSRIEFSQYLIDLGTSIIGSYNSANLKIHIEFTMKALHLDIATAVPLGLIFHEVLINACRHAFLNRREGNIHVSLVKAEKTATLKIVDDGVGFKTKSIETATTLGMTLVNGLVKQLDAQYSFKSSRKGVIFQIDVPYLTSPNSPEREKGAPDATDKKKSTRKKENIGRKKQNVSKSKPEEESPAQKSSSKAKTKSRVKGKSNSTKKNQR